jgi:nicotinamide N-methyltransferase
LKEPEGFFRPDRVPTTVTYHRKIHGEKTAIRLGLVASHALWAHHLWNGGVVLADMVDDGRIAVADRSVVELGSGAALPSIVALLAGARCVVSTEYPEQPLLDNVACNIRRNVGDVSRSKVTGFLWGSDPKDVLAGSPGGFDVALLADLLANHTALPDLAQSLHSLLRRPTGVAWVSFGHHRPWLADKDMALFAHCERLGLVHEKVFETSAPPMFADDPGSLAVRSTVHVHRITWPPQ